jgi:tetratricopeptide (TPR) repeat protein
MRVVRSIALLIPLLGAAASASAQEAQSSTILGPGNPLLAEGAAKLEAGRVQEGIELTLAGLKAPNTFRDAAAGHSNVCAGYAMLKQWEEALRHCNTALGLDDSNWRTYNNRAAVFVGLGQYELAIADLRTGLEMAPKSRTLLESLRIAQQNKRLHDARTRTAVRP